MSSSNSSALIGIEAGRRLIKQNKVRIEGEGTGECGAL